MKLFCVTALITSFFNPLFADIGSVITQEILKEVAKEKESKESQKAASPSQGQAAPASAIPAASTTTKSPAPVGVPVNPADPNALDEGKALIIVPPNDTDRMPLRPRPPVSRMPHIPNERPIEMQDKGNFMSHPHPQRKTLPDSAVFPPVHKKNSG